LQAAIYVAPPVLSLIAFIAFWQLYVWYFAVSNFILPSPMRIMQTGLNMGSGLLPHVWTTTYEILLGFFFGNLLAVGLAYMIVRRRSRNGSSIRF
jgi:NitT/TauT family transport system permease protein